MRRALARAGLLATLTAACVATQPATAAEKPWRATVIEGLPGATASQLSGINDLGVFAGTWQGADTIGRAFAGTENRVRALATPPGAWATVMTQRINNFGAVVGWYNPPGYLDGSSSKYHPVLWRDGTAVDLLATDPMAAGMAYSLNDRGDVVGWWMRDGEHQHAFAWRAGRFTDLGGLGGQNAFPLDINNRGAIVGYTYDTTSAVDEGFVLVNGSLTSLGAGFAAAVNDRGQAVGVERPGGGFIWSRGTKVRIEVTGCLPASTRPMDINLWGAVAGDCETPTHQLRAFVWRDGEGRLLPGPAGATSSGATAINVWGQIAGQFRDAGGADHGVVWERG